MTTLNTFEEAYVRLEAILEKMQENALPLEDALKLYEEADRLISQCEKRLVTVEERIEILVKTRSGELVMNEAKSPQTQSFAPQPMVTL